jgi:phosphate:Na+ symporter
MFGGVVAMMFGMKIMGGGLEKFAGGRMKAMLGKATSNRFAGVGVGIAVTSIIQSSTATTVMLVGFVNIGLMNLVQATNVIMGANIGTTVTAHIVSLSGVGNIDIGAIAAFIGFAGIMMSMFIKTEKIQNIGNILAGLGLIFVGLEFISIYAKKIMFMESGVPYPLVENLFQTSHSPLILILIGIVITALVHSSSTITSLMVVLASIKVLSFENALFLALGSNIGTCVTSILSSVGTCTSAKRTAIVHLLFNVIGCLIFLIPLWILSEKITNVFASISDDVGQQIAIFHTLFNVVTTLLMLPFVKYVVKLASLIIPEPKKEQEEQMRFAYLDYNLLETPAVAVGNIRKEIVRMSGFAKENLNLSMEMLLDSSKDNSEVINKNEKMLNYLNRNMTAYMTKVMAKPLSVEDDKKIGSYFHVVSDLERVGDYSENIMEYAYKLREEDLSFSVDAVKELEDVLSTLNKLFDVTMEAFDKRDVTLLDSAAELEEQVDEITKDLEIKHIERVKFGRCVAQVGSVYLQTVSNLERVGDHVNNVAFSITHYRKSKKTVTSKI